MSRKMKRRSSIRDSSAPYLSSTRTSSAEALLFKEQYVEGETSPSSYMTEVNQLILVEKNSHINAGRKSSRKSSSKSIKMPFEISSSGSTRSKKSSTLVISEPAVTGSGTSDTIGIGQTADVQRSVKLARRRKVRHTEDLNFIKPNSQISDIESKTKTKTIKKARLPSFLPPVDMIVEDKKQYSSVSSGTSDCDRENHTNSGENILIRKSKRNRKEGVSKRKSEQLIEEDKKRHSSFTSENGTTESDNKENEMDFEGNTKIRRGKSKKNKKRLGAKRNSDKVIDEEKKLCPLLTFETSTTESDNKDNETDLEENTKVTRGKSRKNKKRPGAKRNSDEVIDEEKLTLESGTTESDNRENETDFEENTKVRRGKSKKQKRKRTAAKVNSDKSPHENELKELVLQDSTVHTTLSENADHSPEKVDAVASCTSDRKESSRGFVSMKISPDKKLITAATPKLRREGTFEISTKDPDEVFSVDVTSVLGSENKSRRETYDKVPAPKINTPASSKNPFNCSDNMETIDLTDSPADAIRSASNKPKRDTNTYSPVPKVPSLRKYTKSPLPGKRSSTSTLSSGVSLGSTTSSSDVSFNYNKGKSQSEDVTNYVTERSGVRSYDISSPIDYRSFSKVSKSPVLSKPRPSQRIVPKKSILKKPVGRVTRGLRRDTFEIAESFYKSIERVNTGTNEDILEVSEMVAQQDIFDMVSNTPTNQLRHLMINDESILLANSFVNQTGRSLAPRLTISKELSEEKTKVSQTPDRRSTRKRWSQVERTPIFNNLPVPRDNSQKSLLEGSLNVTKSKSVTFYTSPAQLASTTKLVNKNRSKKSVKIESPATTPKMRLHSPLVVKKTPKPHYAAADSSILAGNCALSEPVVMSPPSSSSTPYHRKKDVSLLKKVLTNEKSRAETLKSSSRVKMPNFRKIHERQFEKMENIKELQERKALRAKNLLSGCKVTTSTNSSRDEEKESRKKLIFSPLKNTKTFSESGQNLSSKTPSSRINKKPSPSKYVKDSKGKVQKNKRASLEKKKTELKSKVPLLLAHYSPLKGLKTAQNKVGLQKPVVSKVGSKPVQRTAMKKIASSETKKDSPKVPGKFVSRFGFKLATDQKTTKEEQIKAVTAKSKLGVNTTDQNRKQNRKQVTTVRTNRRFELLMQMRANKK